MQALSFELDLDIAEIFGTRAAEPLREVHWKREQTTVRQLDLDAVGAAVVPRQPRAWLGIGIGRRRTPRRFSLSENLGDS